MALSADQRAMLELLLERGQSYEDLCLLLDLSEPEVRARARAALIELGGADPDRRVGLTDYLLGQADPIGRADAVRHLKEDPDDHRLAAGLVSALREVAPGAELPKLPAEPSGGRFLRRAPSAETEPAREDAAPAAGSPPSPGPSRRRAPGRLSELSSSQTRLIVALGSAAVILIAVVLGVTGAFGGGGEGGSSATTTSTTAAADQSIEQVPLRPSDGGDASGTATFGIATGDQPFVDLDISKLEPAPQGKAYVLWLMIAKDQGHPLQPFQVNQDGTYSERIPIQSFLTELAARTQFVDVSLSEQKPLLKAVNEAVNGDTPTPIIPYTGESILRGVVQPSGQ